MNVWNNLLKSNIFRYKEDKNYNNLQIYESLYIKSSPNTVDLKTETNNLNDIGNNLIYGAQINAFYKNFRQTFFIEDTFTNQIQLKILYLMLYWRRFVSSFFRSNCQSAVDNRT